MKGLIFMGKRMSLIEFPDDLVLTYTVKGEDIVVYAEMPNKKRTDFNSVEYTYPAKTFDKLVGFTTEEFESVRSRIEKGARLALECVKCNYA